MDEITTDAIEWDYGPAPEPAVETVAEDAEGTESAGDSEA
jgi:hypothetical protein